MEPSPQKRSVVWVVDDSPLDVERARRVLVNDYAVRTFVDGSAMLEHLASNPPPDVLVLDWVMPGVSGIEVCRFLRSGELGQQLAILLLTTQTQTQQIVEGLAAGANDYLVKPYADPELRARVDALVRWNGLLDRAQKAEAHVLELLEHAPDPLISVDQRSRITYVNVEAQGALGQDSNALCGRPLAEVLPTLPLEQLGLAARHPRPLSDIEIGEQIFAPSVRLLPDDRSGGLTIALRNVTERRRRETRRLDFYSIIAHDLRSPLGAMLMRTDMMLRGRRGILSADLISDLRKMETHMRGLVALINDFLDFARMEEAAHTMERARVEMTGLISEIVEDFKPLIDSTNQAVRMECHGQAVALGDRRRLQQVLTNLVSNAIKFTPANGHITVRARQDEHWCEIAIEDDGPGIPPEIVSTLFQRYTRAPNLRGDAGGTGLGLLIVREIVEGHGGTVGVDSQPGQGSRFWFRVPAAPAAPSTDAFEAAAAGV